MASNKILVTDSRGAGPANPAPHLHRVWAAGTPVDVLTPERLLEIAGSLIGSSLKKRVIFCNVSTVVEGRRNPDLSAAVREAEIVSPDGMPLVWLARLKGRRDIARVDGPSFMASAMRRGVEQGWRHYLYGGSPDVLVQLTETLEVEIPGVSIVGSQSPPYRDMTPGEQKAAIDEINAAQPDFVWVGLGMPKQEVWMARFQRHIHAPLLLGVGAAFDFHAGAKKRAPAWMRASGLEWLHRFAQEPRRLWRRYMIGNALFVWLAGLDILSGVLGRSQRPK